MRLFLFGGERGHLYAIDNICKRNRLNFAVVACPERWQDAAAFIKTEKPEYLLLFHQKDSPDTLTLAESLHEEGVLPMTAIHASGEDSALRRKAAHLGSPLFITQISENSITELFLAMERRLAAKKAVADRRPSSPAGSAAEAVPRVVDYLNLHYGASITNDTLSQEFMFPVQILCKAFKKAAGMTPLAYLEGRRIAKAKEIMRYNPALPIKTVAMMVGYSDPLYFSKVFRKHESVSPLQFLRESGGK